MVMETSNVLLILLKVAIAGVFAFMTGNLLDWHAVSYIMAAVVGLMGVKSFEFVLSLFGY